MEFIQQLESFGQPLRSAKGARESTILDLTDLDHMAEDSPRTPDRATDEQGPKATKAKTGSRSDDSSAGSTAMDTDDSANAASSKADTRPTAKGGKPASCKDIGSTDAV